MERASIGLTIYFTTRVLIAHTCFGCSGGLAPISLPLFQGVLKVDFHCLAWSYSSVAEGEEHASRAAVGAAKSCQLSGSVVRRSRDDPAQSRVTHSVDFLRDDGAMQHE
jgi:hypothetical protein